jgi:hypothetical protein
VMFGSTPLQESSRRRIQRYDFVATSCRAAISFVVRECRSAGD